MSFPASKVRWGAALIALGLFVGALGMAAIGDEPSFLSENDAAMRKMMAGMAVKPYGDVDRDFVATMLPHHQGAIEMEQAELRHGRNEQLRRLAQEIIVEQGQEIAVMRLALGQPAADNPAGGRRATDPPAAGEPAAGQQVADPASVRRHQ